MKKRGQSSLFSQEEKEEILSEYHQSGLPQQQFCQQRGIKFSTFKNWKYSKIMSKETRVSPSSFIEVKIKDDEIVTDSQMVIKIIHPNGTVIEIPRIIERKGLSNLLELLGMKK